MIKNPPAGNPAGGVSKTIWKELKMQTMTEQEQKNVAVEKFVAIQRIKKYGNEELEYQEKMLKKELQMLGIKAEDFVLK